MYKDLLIFLIQKHLQPKGNFRLKTIISFNWHLRFKCDLKVNIENLIIKYAKP